MSGMTTSALSVDVKPHSCDSIRTPATIAAWLIMTPLALPVVPLVYIK